MPCLTCGVLNSINDTDTLFACIQCCAQHDALLFESMLNTVHADELVPTDTPDRTVLADLTPSSDSMYDEHKPDQQLLHEQFAHANVNIPSGLHSKHHLPKTLSTKCTCTTCMMTWQSEKLHKSEQLHNSPRASKPLPQVNIDLHRPYPDHSSMCLWQSTASLGIALPT